jgi:hypothetical protein
MLQRYIRALADLFVNVKKYQQAFLVVVVVFEPSLPVYPLFYLSLFFTPLP